MINRVEAPPPERRSMDAKKSLTLQDRKSELFSPIPIGSLELKNRIVFPAASSELGNPNGSASLDLIEYYAQRAIGGAAMVIVEAAYVDRRGKRLHKNLLVDNDEFIPSLRVLASAIKKAGARAALQLNHGGRACIAAITGVQPVAPSRIPAKSTSVSPKGEMPRELTLKEIRQIVEAFGAAAVRAKAAGFEAVEVHGAHGYLISNFLSPEANHRTDKYGGSIRNRARLFVEVVREVKRRVRKGFPVIARLNCQDYLLGGLEFTDAIVAAQLLEKAGADALHVSGGVHSSEPYITVANMTFPLGVFADYAARLKQVTKIPVIAVNRIHDPIFAEQLLKRGAADLVAMGRPLIADPYLPAKARAGELEDITPCVACNECLTSIYNSGRVACTANPFAGQELGMKGKGQNAHPKRVVVIGGGPAGMSCAVTAAKLGHKVTLFEKNTSLGGLLRLAILPPKRETLDKLLVYLEHQVAKAGIDVRLGQEFKPELCNSLAAEVYVVATGAEPLIPSIPGVNSENLIQATQALLEPHRLGQHCVVIGAGLVGIEVADFVVSQGNLRRVVVIENTSEIMRNAPGADIIHYRSRMRDFGVEILTRTQVTQIKRRSVVIELPNGWREEILDVDTVILATGWKPDKIMASELTNRGVKTVTIGDAAQPRKLINAIQEGAMAAFDV